MEIKRLAILTSGGDAPGMNAAIRSAVRFSLAKGIEIWGIYRGYEGLLEEEIRPLSFQDVGGIIVRGGTMLKTARSRRFFLREMQEKAAEILRKREIDGLLVVGGDGSMAGAAALEALGVATAVIPATIDNDMGGTEETVGFDTAVNTALDALRKIRDTASSHDRAAIVEVMGRHAGYIALAVGLSGGAEFILVPEIPFDEDKLAQKLSAMTKEGRTNSIILCAEGATDAHVLGKQIAEKTGIDTSVTILGYIQRGGAPTAKDATLATVLAAKAIEALLSGKSGFLAGMRDGHPQCISYKDAFSDIRKFPEEIWELAMQIGNGEI